MRDIGFGRWTTFLFDFLVFPLPSTLHEFLLLQHHSPMTFSLQVTFWFFVATSLSRIVLAHVSTISADVKDPERQFFPCCSPCGSLSPPFSLVSFFSARSQLLSIDLIASSIDHMSPIRFLTCPTSLKLSLFFSMYSRLPDASRSFLLSITSIALQAGTLQHDISAQDGEASVPSGKISTITPFLQYRRSRSVWHTQICASCVVCQSSKGHSLIRCSPRYSCSKVRPFGYTRHHPIGRCSQ